MYYRKRVLFSWCFSRKYNEHVSDHIKQIHTKYELTTTHWTFLWGKFQTGPHSSCLFWMDLLLFLWNIKQDFSEMFKFYSYRTNAHLFDSWSSFAEFLCLMSHSLWCFACQISVVTSKKMFYEMKEIYRHVNWSSFRNLYMSILSSILWLYLNSDVSQDVGNRVMFYNQGIR